MDIHALIQAIEATAPLSAAASWDASGLQVAARRSEVEALAVCLDPTPASVECALELGCDCILSHHPLSLSPKLPKTLDAFHTVLSLLLCARVPLYAAHTSLDTNLSGPAGWLADELQLTNRSALERTGETALTGFGLVGDLTDPLPAQAFVERLFTLVKDKCTTVTGRLPGRIKRVAYCTGSGGSLLREASCSGADVYISGDIKYHAALEAAVCVIDVGHHSLEEEMMRRFSERLRHDLPDLTIHFVPSVSPFRPLFEALEEDSAL